LGKKIEGFRKPASKLSDVLGEEHDLTIVLELVNDLEPADREALEEARRKLRSHALAMGVKMRA
jgi:hypothetical protein